MGSKCCAPHNQRMNKIQALKQSELIDQLHLKTQTLHLLGEIHEYQQHQAQELHQLVSMSVSEQQSQIESPKKTGTSSMPPKSKQPGRFNHQNSLILVQQKILNNSVRHFSEGLKPYVDNLISPNIERLDVPKIKQSPSIRVSKEWINEADEFVQMDSKTSFTKMQTMGVQNEQQVVEVNIIRNTLTQTDMGKVQQPPPSVSVSPAPNDDLMRKQSTIHQIRKKGKNRKNNASSPAASDISQDNWQKGGNNSIITSQNSLTSQNKHKAVLQYLESLNNGQSNQQAVNKHQAIDDFLLDGQFPPTSNVDSGQSQKKKVLNLGNKKYLNLQGVANFNQGLDKDSIYHSSTPQFNHESFMRGTSRSSNNEEALIRLQNQNKNLEFEDHNLQIAINDESQSHQYQQFQLRGIISNSQNPSAMSFGMNLGPNIRSPSQTSFINEEFRFSNRNEIVEDDNESKCSSVQDRRRTNQIPGTRSRKHSRASSSKGFSNKPRSPQNLSKQGSKEDSFRSTMSIDQDYNENLQIPLSQIKANEPRVRHSKIQGTSHIVPNIVLNSMLGKQNTTGHRKESDTEQQIIQLLSQLKENNLYIKNNTLHYQHGADTNVMNINEQEQKTKRGIYVGNELQAPLQNQGTLMSSIQPASSVNNLSTNRQYQNLINLVRQQSNPSNPSHRSEVMQVPFEPAPPVTLPKEEPLLIPQKRNSGMILQRGSANTSPQGGGLIRPLKSLTKKISDDEGLSRMMSLINQKKQEKMKKDLRHLIQAKSQYEEVPLLKLKLEPTEIEAEPSHMEVLPKRMIQRNKQRSGEVVFRNLTSNHEITEEEEIFDLSEMLDNTRECVTPSEFAHTPQSQLDATNKSLWQYHDQSLDYSTMQIEFLADKTDGQSTPQDATPKNKVNAQTNPYKPILPQLSNYKDKNKRHSIIVNFNHKRPDLTQNSILQAVKNSQNQAQKDAINQSMDLNNKNFEIQQKLINTIDPSANLDNTQTAVQNLNMSTVTGELTRDNLKKLEFMQQYSNDETPKSQITKSVISGRDEKGKRKINQYIVLSELGKGSYAEVHLCLNADNKNKYAMKILNRKKLNRIFISKNRTALEDVEKEIAIMKKLNHPNVVNLIEVLDDPSNDKLYIIMEYVMNGSLMRKLNKSRNPFNLQQAWKYFRDLIQGLNYLHESAGVIHRDIKPDNLLIDENDRIKIADFGVSFLMENGSDEISTTKGSNYFFAPEVCQGTIFKGRKSDIWAAGVTLYQMVFKKYPFTSNNFPELYHKIQNLEPDYPADANIQLVDMLKKIFIKDPNERANMMQIMNHDWVTSNGVHPIPFIHYPKVEVTKKDTQNLFKNVWVITKIKLKLRQQLNNKRASGANPSPQQRKPSFRKEPSGF